MSAPSPSSSPCLAGKLAGKSPSPSLVNKLKRRSILSPLKAPDNLASPATSTSPLPPSNPLGPTTPKRKRSLPQLSNFVSPALKKTLSSSPSSPFTSPLLKRTSSSVSSSPSPSLSPSVSPFTSPLSRKSHLTLKSASSPLASRNSPGSFHPQAALSFSKSNSDLDVDEIQRQICSIRHRVLMKREKLKKLDADEEAGKTEAEDGHASQKAKESRKSVKELNPLIQKWRETFQEAATDLYQKLRSQREGGNGCGGEMTLENLLLHFRIDPELVNFNREEDSFD